MSKIVLVTGATGKQGGALIRALGKTDIEVVALVRNPASESAKALAEKGIRLAHGDLDEPETLRKAMEGVQGLFSVQYPGPDNSETRQARNLADAALHAGVEQVVHTSVSGVKGPLGAGPWTEFMGVYYTAKGGAEDALKGAGARYTTILRPSTFMENFLQPSPYFTKEAPTHLRVTYDLDVPQSFIAVDDIGRAAAAAFANPDRFNGVELELAGDIRSFRQASEILSARWGKTITLPASPVEAQERGLAEPYVLSQRYMSAHPQPARPEFAEALGLPLTTLEAWRKPTISYAGKVEFRCSGQLFGQEGRQRPARAAAQFPDRRSRLHDFHAVAEQPVTRIRIEELSCASRPENELNNLEKLVGGAGQAEIFAQRCPLIFAPEQAPRL